MKKGFTLIELLVVIGIVAILATVVVLTINPAELLRQARDSNRISDLNTVKAALSLYLSDVATPNLGGTTNCYTSVTTGIASTSCGLTGTYTISSSTSRAVDGNGWLAVPLSNISSGSPLGNLPVDPVNNSTYYYAYAASSSLTFELNANMESTKYSRGGGSDEESTDGGNDPGKLEAGTAPGLAL